MKPVTPLADTQGKRLLLKPRTLKRICEQMRARTPQNAERGSKAGWSGAKDGTAAPMPPLPLPSVARHRVILPSRAWLKQAAECLTARTPREAAEAHAAGFRGSSGAVTMSRQAGTHPAELMRHLRAITPRQTARETPAGYWLPTTPAVFRGRQRLVLEIRDFWATAYFCGLHTDGDTMYQVMTRHLEFENGSYTQTTTAEGGPKFVTPGSEGAGCETAEVTDDRDPEFNYGDPVGEDEPEYSDSYTFAQLLNDAQGAVAYDAGANAAVGLLITDAAALPGTWFELDDDDDGVVKVWFNSGTDTAPRAPKVGRLLEVVLPDDTLESATEALAAALDDEAEFSATDEGGGAVSVEWLNAGPRYFRPGTAPVTGPVPGDGYGSGGFLDSFTEWAWSGKVVPPMADRNLGYWERNTGGRSILVHWPMYRLRNAGGGKLRIRWQQDGPHDVRLRSGEMTDWIASAIPATELEYDPLSSLTVTPG